MSRRLEPTVANARRLGTALTAFGFPDLAAEWRGKLASGRPKDLAGLALLDEVTSSWTAPSMAAVTQASSEDAGSISVGQQLSLFSATSLYKVRMTFAYRFQPIGMFIAVVLVLAALARPDVARAETGFEAGARLGYGIPLGELAEDIDLSDGIDGQIPIWIDVGYRPIDALMIGLYFQYGIGLIDADACDVDGVDCSASDIRLGVQAHYHISPQEQLDPWLGLGLGYEWLNRSVEAMGTEISTTVEGFEFLNLQAGLDIEVAEHFKIGPFLSFSLGQYGSGSADCSGPACGAFSSFEADADIEEKSLHQWLVIGARGAYTP